MSINGSSSRPSSRPTNITILALVVCVLGIGQSLCAGFVPSISVIGILLGTILLSGGVAILSIKRLWNPESLGAYLYFLAGAIFLLTTVNGALGLGIAQYKVPSLFVGGFVVVGLAFFVLGWLHLKKKSVGR